MTSRPKDKSTPHEPSRSDVQRDDKPPQPRRAPPEDAFEEKGPAGGYGGAGCEEDES